MKPVVPELFIDHECRLSGASADLRAALRKLLTISNPRYQDAKRYGRWIGKDLQPYLYFYREAADQIFFPRGFGNQAVRICRQHIGQTPEIIDKRRTLAPTGINFHGDLRPYQQEALDAVTSHTFGVLEAGTGSGKTVMALAIMAARQQPALVLVHTKELLYQWKEQIARFLRLSAGQAGDGVFNPQPITVAIVNTARTHLAKLSPIFGQLVVDECHRVPASLFTDVVSAFDCRYMLGLSATAFRREDSMTRLIHIYMGDMVHSVNSRMLMESGAIVRPHLEQRATNFQYNYQGEYPPMLKALTLDMGRNQQIVRDIVALTEQGMPGTILVVSDRVAHCQVLADLLAGAEIAAAVLTGQSPAEERAQIVEMVRTGQIPVLIATLQLIGEGFDCPGLNTLVLATPITFAGRLLQVAGRIMRPEPGKCALVIDYVDIHLPVLQRSAARRREIFASWWQSR